ncbi:hypothetical protein PQX77_006587 [Marasmius sp. AFHP31]|nr:hypothetical protein PQX77_006587 [Marasmius sp. AFHP31]
MIVDPGEDLRLHTVRPGTTPRDASISDFAYAVSPVYGLYLRQVNASSEQEKPSIRRQFLRLLWSCWSEVWENNNVKLTKKQLQFLRDLAASVVSEYDLHRYYVRIGRKSDAIPANNIPWDEAIKNAIRESRFERWANPDYVASVRPPALAPAPDVGLEKFRSMTWEEHVEWMFREIEQDQQVEEHERHLMAEERSIREEKLMEEKRHRGREVDVDAHSWVFMFQ